MRQMMHTAKIIIFRLIPVRTFLSSVAADQWFGAGLLSSLFVGIFLNFYVAAGFHIRPPSA